MAAGVRLPTGLAALCVLTACCGAAGLAADRGWAHLCPEVAALRADLPGFVVRLGEVYEARQTLSKSRALRLREDSGNASGFLWGAGLVTGANCSGGGGGEGPWRLKVDLAAPKGAPGAYQKHHRVVLVFGRDWPAALPVLRFVGKIRSAYLVNSDQRETRGPDLHTAEASGLLHRRLQEAAGGTVGCMWRQTASCSHDGSNREPAMDLLCDAQIPQGASGFCDCDGDGVKGRGEPGFGCGQALDSCAAVCSAALQESVGNAGAKGPQRHNLRLLLEQLHRSLGEPLGKEDKKLWKRGVKAFSKEASTVLKYEKYGRKHPALFGVGGVPEEQMIDPQLLALIREATAERSREAAKKRLLSSGLIKEVVKDMVFSFRVLKQDFCDLLMEEIHHFYASKLPAKRPNSMNNYGIILNDIGLEPLVFAMQDAVVQPLAAILLPAEGSELESHHSFTIRYRGGEDTHLDVHTDDSDITFNVNIYENYTGAPLVFCGMNGAPDHRKFKVAYQHELGHAVLHSGRHRHGAEDIATGERMNLVVWSYSHNFRTSIDSEKKHEKEDGPPDVRCVSYTHDRDFARWRHFPPGKKEKHLGRGWCPQRGKEYDGFVPDVPDNRQQVPQQQEQ